MWYLLAMFLARGGTMSEQHPTAVKPTDPPPTKPVDDFPARTIEDVQRELTVANALMMEHRARQGHTVQVQETRDEVPALLTQEINWLHEEWAAMQTPGPIA